MASKKTSSPAGKGAAKGAVKKFFQWTWGKIFKRSLLFVLLIALGGFLFNIDRLGNTGVNLLKFKEYLPGFIVRFLPGGTAQEGAAVPDEIISGEVIEVYDGDTLTLLSRINGQEKKYKVRFYGIDAPEAAQAHGTASRDALRGKILGRQVQVTVVSVDRYGRSVGKVMSGVRYINLEMVAEGNAWYYPDYAANEYELAKAEKEARSGRLGLWQESSPQAPWFYRKENRK
ncbi:MAG: thermonuclease family protein [Lentisphaeria bacterium]|nr:thermonuclease family protein [Lentisphaeria bacterium]